jgi:hypothetical protein
MSASLTERNIYARLLATKKETRLFLILRSPALLRLPLYSIAQFC